MTEATGSWSAGDTIRTRRKELGLSQKELGNKVGVSHQQIQKYEAGLIKVAPYRMKAIGKALEMPIKEEDPLLAAIAGLSPDARAALAAVAIRMKR